MASMKKVIIIWWSSGIGEQVAKDMINEWYSVGVMGRRKILLEKLKKQYNHNIEIQDIDIGYIRIANEKIEKLVAKLWWLDILILSAWTWKENFDLDFDSEHETIKTNVLGWTNSIDRATRYFIKQWFWHIVAITSIASLRGEWSCPSYNASKAYQSNYIESLRLNIDKRNLPIKVLEVQPWFIDTRMAQWNVFWLCSVPKASKHIVQAIKRWREHIYVSKRWKIVAWIIKMLPYKMYKKIVNWM